MPDHAHLLATYQAIRAVRQPLNDRLAGLVPRSLFEECGRRLGFIGRGGLVLDSADEIPILMDYCLYYPQADGKTLVAKQFAKSRLPAGSDELAIFQNMQSTYYSMFQIVGVERGVGVAVLDLLRGVQGFIVDIGFGTTAKPGMMMATRIIPHDGFLVTSGGALPMDEATASRVVSQIDRAGFSPNGFDYGKITPQQEAELAAIIISTCRSTGMTARVAYAEPGATSSSAPSSRESRRFAKTGRNDPCPCGSGKKFKVCCGGR